MPLSVQIYKNKGTPAVNTVITTAEASAACSQEGSELTSLTTDTELRGVLSFLWRQQAFAFYVGFMINTPGKPDM